MNDKIQLPAAIDEPPFLPPPAAKVTPGGILLPLALIDAGDRIRQVNAAAVALLADSIAKNGLISPLLVRPTPDDRYRLVIGGHRLAALGLLGATEVRCEIKDLDDDEALSIELDENLSRHELDQLDFGLFCAEREALDERMAERDRVGGDRKTAKAKSFSQVVKMIPRFTAELAQTIGRSEKTVYLAIQIAKDLDGEAVALLRNSKFADNQQALRVISQMPKARQRGAVQDLLDGRFKTAAQVRDAYEHRGDPVVIPPEKRRQDNAVEAFAEAWMKLDDDHRLAALREIVLAGQKAAFIKAVRSVFGDDLYIDPSSLPPSPAKGRRGGAR